MPVKIRLCTLGSLAVLVNGTDVGEMRGRPVRLALLLYLALERTTSRDEIMALLWPESDRDHARQALRQTLYALRQDLGDDWIRTDQDRLQATPSLTADAKEVMEAADESRPERVEELYQGSFLEGFHLAESQPFQLWCDQWRARLERLNRQARRALIDERVAAGDLVAALEAARRWVDLDPLEDEARHRVMEILSRLGRGGEALREYEQHAAFLALEGLEPLDDTRALAEEIRASESSIPPLGADPPGRAELHPPEAPVPGGGWKSPLMRILAPAVVILALGVGILLLRGPDRSEPKLDPRRIMVLPPTNETGDSTLEELGLLAQEWMTHGVTHMGVLKAVPSLDVLTMLESGMTGEVAAAERGAGTVVSGRFFRVGDSVELHIRISDLVSGELWHALDPLRVAVSEPEAGLRELRDRVAGSLAVRFIPGAALPDPSMLDPPSYPAFQAIMDASAFVARGDWAGALPHVQRAARLDTTFYRARLYVVAALFNLGEPARADSVLDALAPSRDRFSEYERLVFQTARAVLRGDWEGRLAAVREAALLDPGGTLHYTSAGTALATGRPREALALYSNLDPHCPWAPEIVWPWSDWTGAHHLLGLHESELREARRARGHHPDRLEALYLELRALVALGRIAALRQVLTQVLTMPPESGWDAGRVYSRTAAELRAHGRPDESDRVLGMGLSWYEARPGEERSERAYRMGYADALLMAGRLSDARAVLEGLLEDHPHDVTIVGRVGVLSARLGLGQRIQEMTDSLEASRGPYTFGAVDYWRAAVAAWSGEEEEALRRLRRAFTEGTRRGIALHADPILEPLWHLPAFSLAVAQES